MTPEEAFRKFGKGHNTEGEDVVYVIPLRDHDEDMDHWARRVVRVSGLPPTDLNTNAVTEAWMALSNALRQFMSQASVMLNSLWTLINDVHDGNPDAFHRLTSQHLGHEAECPVCEARNNATQENGEAPEGEGRGEGGG